MLNLVAALLVILVTAFWAFQGLFSAVIMFCEAMLALMTAFSFYEPMADYWKDSLDKELSEPGFLFVIFFGTLIVLRFLSDKFIPGTIRAHQIVDRVGGGLFGLFTALILVGVMLISVQMLPIGRTTMGFERINPRTGRMNSIWLNADGFTLGLVNMLSNERFAWDDARYEVVKPDLLKDLTLRRAGTQIESRKSLPADAIQLKEIYVTDSIRTLEIKNEGAEVIRDTSKIADRDNPSGAYIVCRVAVDSGKAGEQGEGGAKGSVLFTTSQFRLVGPRPGPQSRAVPHVYPAVGVSDIYIPPPFDRGGGSTQIKIDSDTAAKLVKMPGDIPLVLHNERHKDLIDGASYVIDVVFEVPSDTFDPWYIEFKNGARQEIPANRKIERRSDKAAPTPETGGSDESSSSNDSADDSTKTSSASPAGGNAGNSMGARSTPRDKMAADKSKDKPKPKGKVVVGEQPKGRIGLVGAKEEGTGVMDDLPAPLPKSNNAVSSKLQGDKFHEGHLVIDIADPAPADADAVTKFDVPAGKKMVQLRVNRYFAVSMYGSAMEYAKNTFAQYFLETADGTRFWAKGVYIDATIDGKRTLELQYWYEPMQEERCLEPPIKMTPNLLKANANSFEFAYIFIVDPGVKIVKFYTSARSPQDCTIEVPN